MGEEELSWHFKFNFLGRRTTKARTSKLSFEGFLEERKLHIFEGFEDISRRDGLSIGSNGVFIGTVHTNSNRGCGQFSLILPE